MVCFFGGGNCLDSVSLFDASANWAVTWSSSNPLALDLVHFFNLNRPGKSHTLSIVKKNGDTPYPSCLCLKGNNLYIGTMVRCSFFLIFRVVS